VHQTVINYWATNVLNDTRRVNPIKTNRKYCCTQRMDIIEYVSNNFGSGSVTRLFVYAIRLKWCTTMYHRNRVINVNCSTYTSAKQTMGRNVSYRTGIMIYTIFRSKMFTLIDMTFWNISRHEPRTQGSPLLYNLVRLNWFLDVSFNYFLHIKLS